MAVGNWEMPRWKMGVSKFPSSGRASGGGCYKKYPHARSSCLLVASLPWMAWLIESLPDPETEHGGPTRVRPRWAANGRGRGDVLAVGLTFDTGFCGQLQRGLWE